ncbi:MAG: Gfo/Idh/MocA family protein [Candidatus Poribacteria bacterium]
MKHLKWGIIGTGMIANSFARNLKTTDKATLLAVASRSLDKAKEFAGKYDIPKAYDSYDSILKDDEIDAIYIALPNHLHKEWSIKCAESGKHILCEKPITVNRKELEDILDVVQKCDVFFMEAFMYRCHPQWAKIKQIIADDVIGEVRAIKSTFSYNMGMNLENIRMSNPAAGGGLMDVGCYCVSFSRLIAGEEPIKAKCVGYIGKESRVDQQTAGVLLFPSGAVASFECGTQVNIPTSASVYGSKGYILIENPWFAAKGITKVIIQTDKEEVIEVESDLELYAKEAITVAEYLDARQAPAMTWEDSLGQMRALDMLRADMGLVFDVEK